MIASLVNSGRREEPIQLNQKLRDSGDVSVLVLETRWNTSASNWIISETRAADGSSSLRIQGGFQEAESILKPLWPKIRAMWMRP